MVSAVSVIWLRPLNFLLVVSIKYVYVHGSLDEA